MLKYIVRLDDACPTMNLPKWNEIEKILDKYKIKPIVGVIPNCKDKAFNYKKNDHFWDEKAQNWKNKGWVIALHGYNHNLSDSIRTEFKGLDYETQKEKIEKGINILKEKGLTPVCFFAPNHTFDKTTVKILKEYECIHFVSDGYALYPYEKNGMVFLPSVFDTPHKISKNGIFTFVFHPNTMKTEDFAYLENFIKKNHDNFDVNIVQIVEKYSNRKRNIIDVILHFLIYSFRKIKGTKR